MKWFTEDTSTSIAQQQSARSGKQAAGRWLHRGDRSHVRTSANNNNNNNSNTTTSGVWSATRYRPPDIDNKTNAELYKLAPCTTPVRRLHSDDSDSGRKGMIAMLPLTTVYRGWTDAVKGSLIDPIYTSFWNVDPPQL
jgi:hypothetical protein